MDLNAHPPADWLTKGRPYEIAEFALSHDANVLILLNAWMDSGTATDQWTDWTVVNFWAARLRPLWDMEDLDQSTEEGVHASLQGKTDSVQGLGKRTIVAICNRTGQENGKVAQTQVHVRNIPNVICLLL